jgi:hypothetical protein
MTPGGGGLTFLPRASSETSLWEGAGTRRVAGSDDLAGPLAGRDQRGLLDLACDAVDPSSQSAGDRGTIAIDMGGAEGAVVITGLGRRLKEVEELAAKVPEKAGDLAQHGEASAPAD